MSQALARILRDEIACHDAMLFTTPHLSAIAHKQRELLALLEERNHPADEPCPPTKRSMPPQSARGLHG